MLTGTNAQEQAYGWLIPNRSGPKHENSSIEALSWGMGMVVQRVLACSEVSAIQQVQRDSSSSFELRF